MIRWSARRSLISIPKQFSEIWHDDAGWLAKRKFSHYLPKRLIEIDSGHGHMSAARQTDCSFEPRDVQVDQGWNGSDVRFPGGRVGT
jgi:hypothetical protein